MAVSKRQSDARCAAGHGVFALTWTAPVCQVSFGEQTRQALTHVVGNTPGLYPVFQAIDPLHQPIVFLLAFRQQVTGQHRQVALGILQQRRRWRSLDQWLESDQAQLCCSSTSHSTSMPFKHLSGVRLRSTVSFMQPLISQGAFDVLSYELRS
jgi:hypothetical protein